MRYKAMRCIAASVLLAAPFPLVALPLAAQQSPAQQSPAQQPGSQQPAAAPVQLPPTIADNSIFTPLPWRPGNAVRSASGAPGHEYWQQRADYSIVATLDTAAKQLAGTVTIRYTNNSPDTLRFIWLHVDQNLFRPGSTGSLLSAAESRFGGGGAKGGIEITDAKVGGQAVKPYITDAMMRLDLPRPLPPRGGQLTVTLAYHFAVPAHGADRMGRDGSLYEFAQWYPRMAVYDDVNGWDTTPYLGPSEFYLEYGDFDYTVTVPAGYIVAGTGTLQNPGEVLTQAQRARLAAAVKVDTTVHVVTAAELKSGAARPTQGGARREGTQTWRFRAQQVRDVAWAASPEYLWDATSWDGILIQSFYRPSAAANWKASAQQVRSTIRENSTRWFRFPWPQMSGVEGPVMGMEYPMLAMVSTGRDSANVQEILDHETGHMWFPMIVGSNEHQYPWMDEGFNTFINIFSLASYWKRPPAAIGAPRVGEVFVGQTIMTPGDRQWAGQNQGILAYFKPAYSLLTLRNKVLGPDVFDAAFREYIRRWAYKHPQPEDFFRTIEQVSGQDLAWFWKSWFYTTATLDQAVDSVSAGQNGVTTIVLRNNGVAVMPVELELTKADQSKQIVRLPVEIWFQTNRYAYQLQTEQPIVAVRLNPDGALPDLVPGNNEWKAPAATSTR